VNAPYGTNETPPVMLHAFDRDTGAEAWPALEIGGNCFTGGLAYDAGTLFAVNCLGVVRAIDPETGAVLWSVTLPDAPTVLASPTAKNGRIFIPMSLGRTGEVCFVGCLVAVSQSDGSIEWSAAIEGGGARSSPVVTHDGVYITSGAVKAYKFAPSSGELLWATQPQLSNVGDRTAVLYRGLLYSGFGVEQYGFPGPMSVLDSVTGETVGTTTSRVPPAFSDGVGIFVDPDQRVRAIDVATGDVLWTFLDEIGFGASSAPVIVGGRVFFCGGNNHLVELDLASGDLIWTSEDHLCDAWPNENAAQWMQRGIAEGRGVIAVPTWNGLAVFG
jgi:outer membrane protein assembly factor BamB